MRKKRNSIVNGVRAGACAGKFNSPRAAGFEAVCYTGLLFFAKGNSTQAND